MQLQLQALLQRAGLQSARGGAGVRRLVSLLDRMEACGVANLRPDGGEPLMRRDFLDFTAEIAGRGMRVAQIVTNGLRLTPELLDALEAQGHLPEWFVSFDGIGITTGCAA